MTKSSFCISKVDKKFWNVRFEGVFLLKVVSDIGFDLGMVVPEGETPVPESYWKTLSTCRGSVLGGSCYCIKAKHHVSGFQILQG